MKKFILISFLMIIQFCFGQVLSLYGGENYTTFLGNLNTNRYDSKSIWNPYGDYGSRYNSKSIWNPYGDYGGAYSDVSPFNKYASNPPAIIDAKGNFYGYLTANRAHEDRAKLRLAKDIIKYHKYITEDVGEWYELFFEYED